MANLINLTKGKLRKIKAENRS